MVVTDQERALVVEALAKLAQQTESHTYDDPEHLHDARLKADECRDLKERFIREQ